MILCLSDDKGRYSSARLMGFMIMTQIIIEWNYHLFVMNVTYPLSWEKVTLLASAMGFKSWQRRYEGYDMYGSTMMGMGGPAPLP